MIEQNTISRRFLVKSSLFGLLTAAIPNIIYSKAISDIASDNENPTPHDRYPAIQLELASEVVGVSHFNLDKLKELVGPRPELARSIWDWGYGDWESAIDAASHVGRKDIVDYLIGKGAVPTVFTFALLGEYDAVKTMIAASPGLQKSLGPHGISLMHHAKLALETDGVNKTNAQKLIGHLQQLGDAEGKQYLTVTDTDKEKYLGDYRYGDGTGDGFSVKLSMRKLLSLGKLGRSGGALHRIGANEFTYQGAPSVTQNV